MKPNIKKICIVATVPYALVMFMKPHIAMLAEHYDVTLIANGVEQDLPSLLNDSVHFIPVKIERKISVWQDILSLVNLYLIFRKQHFDVVHSLMPKTALLAMLAATVAGVPHRIHTFTGQVWANKTGTARWALKKIDKFIVACATRLLVDSFSQRLFLIEQGVVESAKITVLGHGSVCGVDIERFKPNLQVRQQMRSSLGIPFNATVYLFLGRVNQDKGIQDLAAAFANVAINRPDVHLLVVGPDEGGMDEILQSKLIKISSQFHRVGFTNRPEDFMACADIFCLPSYREGFGSVIIEAAAAGVPAVASNIYGLVDAVVAGETGILHQPHNIDELKQALLTLTTDTHVRERLSRQALTRAHEYFSKEVLVQAMRQYYQALLS